MPMQNKPKDLTQMAKTCTGCRKPMSHDTKSKTCDNCKQRAAINRQKAKENKVECVAVKDSGEKCTNKVNKDCGNKYCAKHIKEWIEETETGGKKVTRCNSRTQCNSDKPGIKAILPKGYAHKKCKNCLEKERKKDTNRRRQRESFNEESVNKKCCQKCGKLIPLDELIKTSRGDISLYCKHCFEQRKQVENSRDKRDRGYRTNVEVQYYEYTRQSKKRDYEFLLSKEKFENLLTSNCHYCGVTRKKYLVGIDRLDNSKGYIEDNVVPCCKICNMMKNTLNEATFILMCAHIAHNNNFLKLQSYLNIFNNYRGTSYICYKYGAIRRSLDFDISKEDFEKIRNDACYICKRFSDKNHCNGIDRVDNERGYTIDNCKSCCADCNFMKKNLDYEIFIYQCAFVAHQHKDRLELLEKQWKRSSFMQKNITKNPIIKNYVEV